MFGCAGSLGRFSKLTGSMSTVCLIRLLINLCRLSGWRTCSRRSLLLGNGPFLLIPCMNLRIGKLGIIQPFTTPIPEYCIWHTILVLIILKTQLIFNLNLLSLQCIILPVLHESLPISLTVWRDWGQLL